MVDRSVGSRLRKRYPSWSRARSTAGYDPTPASTLQHRIHPSDGTTDAPMDAQSDRLFRRIGIGVVVVGVLMVVVELVAG